MRQRRLAQRSTQRAERITIATRMDDVFTGPLVRDLHRQMQRPGAVMGLTALANIDGERAVTTEV